MYIPERTIKYLPSEAPDSAVAPETTVCSITRTSSTLVSFSAKPLQSDVSDWPSSSNPSSSALEACCKQGSWSRGSNFASKYCLKRSSAFEVRVTSSASTSCNDWRGTAAWSLLRLPSMLVLGIASYLRWNFCITWMHLDERRQLNYRYWPTGAEAPETACSGTLLPDRAWRPPRRLTAIKHLSLPLSSRDLFPSIVPVTHKRPPSSPPYSLAPVSAPPQLASCGATSKPLQSLVSHPMARSLVLSFGHLSAHCRVGGLPLTVTLLLPEETHQL